MARDWSELTKLTQGKSLVVKEVEVPELGVTLRGDFELPRLAELNPDDQAFVQGFLKVGGSIKEMEQVFGVSYPTIKARLNRIAGALSFIETDPAPARSEVLERLSRGEITADQAISELEARK